MRKISKEHWEESFRGWVEYVKEDKSGLYQENDYNCGYCEDASVEARRDNHEKVKCDYCLLAKHVCCDDDSLYSLWRHADSHAESLPYSLAILKEIVEDGRILGYMDESLEELYEETIK